MVQECRELSFLQNFPKVKTCLAAQIEQKDTEPREDTEPRVDT